MSSISRILVNTLIIRIFTSMAVSLFKTLDNIATPCSVIHSVIFSIFSVLDIAFCDFQSDFMFPLTEHELSLIFVTDGARIWTSWYFYKQEAPVEP